MTAPPGVQYNGSVHDTSGSLSFFVNGVAIGGVTVDGSNAPDYTYHVPATAMRCDGVNKGKLEVRNAAGQVIQTVIIEPCP